MPRRAKMLAKFSDKLLRVSEGYFDDRIYTGIVVRAQRGAAQTSNKKIVNRGMLKVKGLDIN